MDRRDFLSALPVAPFVAQALLATRGAAQAAETSPTTAQSAFLEPRFADFALSVRFDELPKDVIDAAKRAVLDTLGCAIGAVGSQPAEIAERTARKTFAGTPGSTIFGATDPASLEAAIFVNGVLVRSLDLNDTYIGTDPLHPSELLPLAIALVEDKRGSGKDLIEAIVAGYEISARVNDAISFMERGFHPLCAASYGVPAIAGKVWGLDKDALANAIGLTAARGYTSFAVNSGAISMMKAMGLSATALDGLFMTRLASQGFTGPSGTLEWTASRMKPEKKDLRVDLEKGAFRLPRVAFKRFPIQIELQAIAEIGASLSSAIPNPEKTIKEISVETYPGIISRVADATKYRPKTKGAADHSLPVCLAMALLDGDITVSQFENNRWQNADVFALVDKIRVKPSDALVSKIPKGRGASVEITLLDGRTFSKTIEVAEGDPDRPLSQESLERKFTGLATPVLGVERSRAVVKLVRELDALPDIRSLTAALRNFGQQKRL